ncbi:GD11424 [Drosophila simulans]|nr:GD11424 [Drosophila simulans]
MRGHPAIEEHDIANSLIELSTLTQPVDVGLFNEHSNSADNSIGMLRNTLCDTPQALTADDANLDNYFDTDADPEAASHERDAYLLEAAIDVVGEAELETAEDTATATEEQDEEDEEDEDQEEDDQEEEKAADEEEQEEEEEDDDDDDSDNHDENEENRGLLAYLA